MGDTTRQPADRFHLLGLVNLLLKAGILLHRSLLVRDVLPELDQGDDFAVVIQDRIAADEPLATIGSSHFRALRCPLPLGHKQRAVRAGFVALVPHLVTPPPHERFRWHAHRRAARAIRPQNPQVRVVVGHHLRRGVQDQVLLPLALHKRPLGLLPIRHVDVRSPQPHDSIVIARDDRGQCENPPVAPIPVTQSVFDGMVLAALLDAMLDLLERPRRIGGVDATMPLTHRIADVIVTEAELQLPLGRETNLARR